MSAAALVAIVGPTAAGKTELAVWLGERLGAEIVSVDSRQVYRRLDVGTAKPDPATLARVRHHLLDLIEPEERLDAGRYAVLGRAAIAEVQRRGRVVLLCGGSGFYLRALTEGLFAGPPPDPGLRRELDAVLAERGPAALHAELARVDPEAARRLAPRDGPRIRRALEVIRSSGRPISAWQAEHRFADRPWRLRCWVLSPPTEILDRRIEERARAMWQGGLLEETAALLAAGLPPALPSLQTIGYREAQAHLRGELPAAAAVAAMARATRQYAKRQRTWFRRLPEARWLSGVEPRELVLEELRAAVGG